MDLNLISKCIPATERTSTRTDVCRVVEIYLQLPRPDIFYIELKIRIQETMLRVQTKQIRDSQLPENSAEASRRGMYF